MFKYVVIIFLFNQPIGLCAQQANNDSGFYKNGNDGKLASDKTDFDEIEDLRKQRVEYDKTIRRRMDSLKNELLREKIDSLKYFILTEISWRYWDLAKFDSSSLYYQMALEFAEKNKLPRIYQIWALQGLGYNAAKTGNYPLALQYAYNGLHLAAGESKYNLQIAFHLLNVAYAHAGMGDLRKALDYCFMAKKTFETRESGHMAIQDIAETYLKMHMLDSALYYNQKAYYIADTGHNQQYMIDFAFRVFAGIYSEKGEDELALKYYRQFVYDFYKHNLNNREIDRAYLGMAKLFQKKNKVDSCIFYARRALATAQFYNDQEHVAMVSELLYHLYDSLNNVTQALRFLKVADAARDSVTSLERTRQMQYLAFNEQVREKEIKELEVRQARKIIRIASIAGALILIVSFLIWNRIRQLRLKHKVVLEKKEAERIKVKYEKELLTLEAKALSAQMNPHFIYNCLNSIKALIQTEDKLGATEYLTTFSKLIRTIFHNSDKRQISLYDEMETCRLYTQLEAMRLNGKLKYEFCIDPDLDLKSVMVPALIVQPFIENAIWHGIVPKSEGGVTISVRGNEEAVICEVEDDGVGRDNSKLNKPITPVLHESKGVYLSQQRLDLERALNDTNASIEIIDKYDNNRPTGTKVILNFNLN